jgi:5-methylcytosine-specific restriction endonuclease McrA
VGYEAHRDEWLARDHAKYVADPEPTKERARVWIAANPERVRESRRTHAERRRATMAGLPNTLTASEWQETLAYYHHRCAYCLRPLSDIEIIQEHVVPVVREGGYTQDNIVPSCKPCNDRKGTKLLWEMVA